MNPKVSIITVNYKQPQVTCELLDSIALLDYPNLEVILVDNAQSGNDTRLYKDHYHSVIVMNVQENSGFAGGNNIGIKAATGDFIFLVNNDTELENGLIESLINRFDENNIGAVSPILKYHSEPSKIQFAGFSEINTLTGRNEMLREEQSDKPYSTPYFHGAAVMLKREVINQCGLMPEEYFLYYEELEWSRIIRREGFSILVDPDVHVMHKESVSTGKNSPLKLYYQIRNRVHFMRRNNWLKWLAFLMFFLFISIPKNYISYKASKKSDHLRALRFAIYDGLIAKRFGLRTF